MSTKTISLSEEAYTLLKNMKGEKESFTETVFRIAKKDPLAKLAGILTKEESAGLRKSIKDERAKTDERLKRISERLR
jgi:predicted CopG family antitoxin